MYDLNQMNTNCFIKCRSKKLKLGYKQTTPRSENFSSMCLKYKLESLRECEDKHNKAVKVD